MVSTPPLKYTNFFPALFIKPSVEGRAPVINPLPGPPLIHGLCTAAPKLHFPVPSSPCSDSSPFSSWICLLSTFLFSTWIPVLARRLFWGWPVLSCSHLGMSDPLFVLDVPRVQMVDGWHFFFTGVTANHIVSSGDRAVGYAPDHFSIFPAPCRASLILRFFFKPPPPSFLIAFPKRLPLRIFRRPLRPFTFFPLCLSNFGENVPFTRPTQTPLCGPSARTSHVTPKFCPV